jgi:methyltransferase (TIGR00027 family)
MTMIKKNEASFFIRMPTSQASQTAQLMAMFRALETTRRPRLFADPFAIHFLKLPMRIAIRAAEKIPPFQARLARFIDERWPGARTSGVARTAYIDNAVRSALAGGVEQVAILGAGYDSRAYRMAETQRVRVFEVDRAETQKLKRRLLARVPGILSQHVTFVEIDFLRETLSEALSKCGFDRKRKTCFVWEGVSHYLDSASVDATMRFAGSCAAGSGIVFTYVHRGLLDGSARFSVGANVSRLLEKAGEPWKFGLYPEELQTYLRDRGLELVEDLGAVEYGARCMGASKDQMKGYEFYHVAIAAIGDSGGRACPK